MPRILHKVVLVGRDSGGRLPPQETGLVLEALPDAVRDAVSMALRGRVTRQGDRPGWLARAADIRLVGMEGDTQRSLLIEAPAIDEALGEDAPRQESAWLPGPTDTGLDLLGDVLKDVEAGNADSERFDRRMLTTLLRFRQAFRTTFSALHLETQRHPVGEPARLSQAVLTTATRLLDETPPPRRVRVVGRLGRVRGSARTFRLTVEAEDLRGVLVAGGIKALGALQGKDVLAFGRAVFRPSGRLLRLDVEEYRPAQDADRLFAKIPRPIRSSSPVPTPRQREQAAEALRHALGKWPGDETEEQIRLALEELS